MSKHMDDVLDSPSLGVLIIDRDHTIVYANGKMTELYGSQAAGIIGKKCHTVFHNSPIPCEQSDFPDKQCSHREVFAKGQPVTKKHQHLLPDGSIRIFEISVTPIMDETNVVVRLIQVLRDISVEEKLRDELAVSHQTLKIIFTNIPFALSFIDKEMRVIRLNPAMETLVGIRTGEAEGRHCYDCWGQYAHDVGRCGRERICDVCQVPTALLDGRRHSHERRVGGKVLEIVSSPVRDADGAIIGAMEVGYDITERHEARVALKRSENDYRALFENSPNALGIADFSGIRQYLSGMAPGYTTDHESFFRKNPGELAACLSHLRFSRVNQATLELFGAASEQELNKKLLMIIWPETVPQTAGGVGAIGRGETSYGHEIVLRHLLTGTRIYCILRWNVVPGYEESYQRVILSLADISARKNAEDKLAGYRVQLLETEEAERRHLAGELHDKLGQQLTALGLNLNILEQSLPPEQELAQHGRIADMVSLLEEMTGQVRNIMADLRPPVLDDYGLGAALRWYGNIFDKRSGIACELKGADIPRLPTTMEIALFRVVQEALNNVGKHSLASRVEIRSALDGSRLSLVVQDNGRGFPETDEADMPETTKLGLISMGERVTSIGGTLAVTSAQGSGTIVSVEVEI